MATTKRTRTRSEVGNQLQGLITMADPTRLENEIASALNIPATKARTTVNNIVRRATKTNGVLAARSKQQMDLLLETIVRLKPAIEELVSDLKTKLTYKSGKTGKRESSWIRNLMAGFPRLHAGDTYFAYVEITKEQAVAICENVGIELPTEVVE